MKKYMFILVLLLFTAGCGHSVPSNKTSPVSESASFTDDMDHVFICIAGSLEWKDAQLSSFEKKNRKDEELYHVFLDHKVPASQIIFLKDSESTLKNMQENIRTLLNKTDKNSRFVFYYAGHGMHENGEYYFANYDINTSQPATTGFNVNFLYEEISKNFKGEKVSLFADCCYSGALVQVAEKLSQKGFKTLALTSATATNTSTGNWTFSQTLIDCINGLPIMDINRNGDITILEVADNVKNAMMYRERQLYGFGVFNETTSAIFSKSKGSASTAEKTGEYIFAMYKGKWEVARITDRSGDDYVCEFYFYSDKVSSTLPAEKTREPYFVKHTTGSKIQVESEGKWYEATIEKTDGNFYLITYQGYDHSYDEWVLYDRIRTGTEQQVNIAWNGSVYPAEILDADGNKIYVHYSGYDFTWDEWTTRDQIRR